MASPPRKPVRSSGKAGKQTDLGLIQLLSSTVVIIKTMVDTAAHFKQNHCGGDSLALCIEQSDPFSTSWDLGPRRKQLGVQQQHRPSHLHLDEG